MNSTIQYISASYQDDDELLSGLKILQKKGLSIIDVLTPFPVHGIDKVLGYRRSWIARVGFIGGAIGAISGLALQIWVFTRGYPINFGGKPFLSLPSFIPVTFELTVLFAAFAMVFAFFMRSNLGMGARNKIYHERITDDTFVVVVKATSSEADSIKNTLIEAGADIVEDNTEN